MSCQLCEANLLSANQLFVLSCKFAMEAQIAWNDTLRTLGHTLQGWCATIPPNDAEVHCDAAKKWAKICFEKEMESMKLKILETKDKKRASHKANEEWKRYVQQYRYVKKQPLRTKRECSRVAKKHEKNDKHRLRQEKAAIKASAAALQQAKKHEKTQLLAQLNDQELSIKATKDLYKHQQGQLRHTKATIEYLKEKKKNTKLKLGLNERQPKQPGVYVLKKVLQYPPCNTVFTVVTPGVHRLCLNVPGALDKPISFCPPPQSKDMHFDFQSWMPLSWIGQCEDCDGSWTWIGH